MTRQAKNKIENLRAEVKEEKIPCGFRYCVNPLIKRDSNCEGCKFVDAKRRTMLESLSTIDKYFKIPPTTGSWTISTWVQKNNNVNKNNIQIPKEIFDSVPADGQWHHVAFLSNDEIYVDGKRVKGNDVASYTVHDRELSEDDLKKLSDMNPLKKKQDD